MKPIYYRKYITPPDQSFLVRYEEIPYTYNHFHYHDEYELLYNIENCGTRFLGDSIHRFDNGDLVLVGPNIPHYWHSDEKYFQDKDLKAKVVLVQFMKVFFEMSLFQLPEMKLVGDLLSRAAQGIQIYGKEAELIGNKLQRLPFLEGWKKMTQMIEILCEMSEAKRYRLLASHGFSHARWLGNEEKISKIFNYMVSNYQKELNLKEMASYVHMNETAFCRYFKQSTSRTFSDILNEIRIGFACKALINTDKSISEVAYDCGYLNVPYFNRVFKKTKNTTPLQYRNIYKGKNKMKKGV